MKIKRMEQIGVATDLSRVITTPLLFILQRK
nr:MAG TPA: hypothetical protein [Caudoviricetes sp.]